MSEKKFKSSLPMEEIENNFKDTNFFDGVMEGLEEALAYEKGTAKTETIARKKKALQSLKRLQESVHFLISTYHKSEMLYL